MFPYTPHQARYFAEQITLRRSESSVDALVSAMSGVKVDLKPHQVDAALFALNSPLRNGALLADEVGLGKTIEAGLVLAQYWSERKRHVLLIAPASLRMQWRAELSEKFYIDSVIMDSKLFRKERKAGRANPFDLDGRVIICTYEFAAGKKEDIQQAAWDLVIIDEAHKLRNVYKSSNIRARKLKDALSGRHKLLLTATPLQNSLMELYGLTSIIDERIFGTQKTFDMMYVKAANPDVRDKNLRDRLRNVCKRTLRRDVREYINYTERHPILQRYEPTPEEQRLYDAVTEYLRTEKLYALPDGQRTLITLVLRKLLASSSFAIHGTLRSLIGRLEALLNGEQKALDLGDFDSFSEYEDEEEAEKSGAKSNRKGGGKKGGENGGVPRNREEIEAELRLLRSFAALAKSIQSNAKGEQLLIALEEGFAKIPELGGQKKAVIFTESRRTQQYIYDILSQNGYAGKIVFLNGANDDAVSQKIYQRWKERHKSDGLISGSKQADVKAAVVEAFRDEASILIGTEAAAEGINLQFCSIVVNYDLPWNPQRIEQRIGRCHRYGQKNDVVVINFLNENNAADKRVYDLLDQKFQLFSGVFGASDEILGSVESGVDFEKRIAEIYQKCKSREEIQREFDALQKELAEPISERMLATRQSVLENFDEDVIRRLKVDTVASLDRFSQWMYYFLLIYGGERAVPLGEGRVQLAHADGTISTYNLKWQEAEAEGDIFLRKEDGFFREWLDDAIRRTLAPVTIRFDNTHAGEQRIRLFSNHEGLCGTLSIDKFLYAGADTRERLIFTAETNDALTLDEDVINRMLELPGTVVAGIPAESEAFAERREAHIKEQRQAIERENKEFYLAECGKLDAYFEEMKDGLEEEVKELGVLLTEKRRMLKATAGEKTLAEIREMKEEIDALTKKRGELRKTIYDRQDALDLENQRLQEEILKRMEGRVEIRHIMTIGFEIA